MKTKFIFFFIFLTASAFAQLDFGAGKKFTKADTLRGSLSPMRTCYTVKEYDLNVHVDIDHKYISGSNTILFTVAQNFKKLQIDLFANMNIDKIEYEGQELTYTREYNAVFVEFPDTLKQGSAHSFIVYYSGNPQPAKHAPWDGGFSWDTDNGNPFVGVSCQGTGASLWWPCKDHQSAEPAAMSISITVPPGLDEVSNGRLIKKTVQPDGWVTFEWRVTYPINNYDVTLNITKYKHFSDTYYNPAYPKDTLTLDYYVLPENYEKAQKQFAQVKPMMDCFYKLFGEYPFVRDGYKLVEAPYLGMEHQSCVEYGNKYRDGYLGMSRTDHKFDFIIIHESVHEWWGNSITTNDVADMWIHEGFATYAEALYIEYLYGHDAYMEYMSTEKKTLNNDKPITGIYGVNKEGSSDMYSKGALLLHTIRSIMDDDAKFFAILKGIQEKFKYKTVNSIDIEKYINEQSGIDFSQIFDQYLHYAAIPKLHIIYSQVGADLKIAYKYDVPETGNFAMPVKITVEKGKYDFIIPTTKTQLMTLKNMSIEDLKVATDLFYISTEISVLDEDKLFKRK
ncbi:MAG: aminopeptidase [Bacteroidetes bacterium]|nr:aminopeptidase [Bacteroidota bacterium]